MQQRNVAREVGLVVASIAVMVHWLDPGPALLVAALTAAAAAVATGPVVGEWRPWRMPTIPMALPALAAFSIAGIARVVVPVPWLILDFVIGWAVVARVFALETAPDVLTASVTPDQATAPPAVRMRPVRRAEYDLPQIVAEPMIVNTPELPPHPHPMAVRVAALGLAFLGFVGAGGMVPNGLALARESLTMPQLMEFAILCGLVAGVAGYRLAALGSPHRFDRVVRVVAFGQFAVVVAITGGVLRTVGLQRLFVPALLTLVIYVLTALRESPDPLVENRSLFQELVVLCGAAFVVIVWGLMIQ
jgi:hypothetical protein